MPSKPKVLVPLLSLIGEKVVPRFEKMGVPWVEQAFKAAGTSVSCWSPRRTGSCKGTGIGAFTARAATALHPFFGCRAPPALPPTTMAGVNAGDSKLVFESSEEVKIAPTFDALGLKEDLLRGASLGREDAAGERR